MVPEPRRIELLGGPGSLAEIEWIADPALPPQGYELTVGERGATIRHADAAGRRYAQQTVAQLAASPRVEAQRIVDHPDVLHRGFMLDISRDRVPTNNTLAWLVEVLAALRYNHLELYMEHTFAYAGHDPVWAGAAALTPDDLRWLDAMCVEHGITLVANQNTFGHMERWLRHDAYRGRAECPDGAISPFGGRPMPPATLAPTAENAEFVLGLVRELAAQVRSSMVNIGADEPFELGQGVSAPDVANRGRAAVYTEHLNRILRPLIEDGYEVLFWGDVLRRHPDLVAKLPPRGATAIVWNYEAPSSDAGLLATLGSDLLETLGLPDDAHQGFASHVRSFVETGYPHWVAPGTSTWNSLLGRWTNARENLLDAAVVGRSSGAQGYLVADWGDNGHIQPLVVSLLPLAYGAGVAWCAETNAGRDVTGVVDGLTGVEGLGAMLAELGDVHLLSGVTSFNGSPLFAALDPTRPLPLIGRGTAGGHAATMQVLEAAREELSTPPPAFWARRWLIRNPGRAQKAQVLRDELLAAVRLARQGAWRLARRDGVVVPDEATLAADLAECVELQRAAWLASSRPGGLDDSLRHVPAID